MSNKKYLRKGIKVRDGQFTTNAVVVNVHPTKRLHWVAYTGERSFESFGSPPPINIVAYIEKLMEIVEIAKIKSKRKVFSGQLSTLFIILNAELGTKF